MVRLKFLYFNDVHSRFEELARVASAVEELRDEGTLVFDGGDNADFARLEVEGTCGVISSAILNRMGVDARVFGNNEGFAGGDNSRILSEFSECPVVTCNMYDLKGRKLRFLDDAAILECSSVRVLVVGVTAPINAFYELFGIHVKEPEEEIRRVLDAYEGFGYDLVVVLSHLGLKKDKEVASSCRGIDVILGGHSHSVLEKPVVENGVIICQAGSFGEYVGVLSVDFDVEKKRIASYDVRLIRAEKCPQHPEINKLIEHYSEVAERNMSKKLCSVPVSLDHSLTDENALGNLLADALRDVLKTEIGMINSGVLHGGIRKGVVTKKLLHETCPSPLNPTYMEIRGSDLWTALEKSLRREYQLADGRGPGSRSKYLGNVQLSHNVQVKVRAGKIELILVNGEPLQLDKWYTVGTSDFLQRGTGYSELGNNRNERYRVEFLRDTLRTYVQKKSFLQRALKRRFVIQ
jgi:2',3'-cyclic-nucleotide 2'-phosphodiesterase (5'-nucleotidase family)